MSSAANGTQVANTQTNSNTRLVDNHQIVGIVHILDSDQITRFLGNLHGANPFATAFGNTVLIELTALTEAIFAHNQQLLRRVRHTNHAHDAIAGHIFEANTTHTGSRAAH